MHLRKEAGPSALINIDLVRESILLAILINHPKAYDHIGEKLGTLAFISSELDKLRQEVLKTLASSSGLEYQGLRDHLEDTGFSELLNGLLSRQVINHANFARPDENIDVAQKGWEQTFRLFRRNQLLEEICAVEEELAENPTRETFDLLKALKQMATVKEDAETDLSRFSDAKTA